MPFLTLLSKRPCVNTADHMAERDTGRKSECDREQGSNGDSDEEQQAV